MPPVRHIQRRPCQSVVMNLLRRPPILEHQRHRIRVIQPRRNPRNIRNRLGPLRLWLTLRTRLLNIILSRYTRPIARPIRRVATIRPIVHISAIVRIATIVRIPNLPRIQPPVIQRPNHSIPKAITPTSTPPIVIPITPPALIKRRPRTSNPTSPVRHARRAHTAPVTTRPVTRNPCVTRKMIRSRRRKSSTRTAHRRATTMKSTTTPTSPTPLRTRRHTNHHDNHRNRDQPPHANTLRPIAQADAPNR
jgi:hypothetical protein